MIKLSIERQVLFPIFLICFCFALPISVAAKNIFFVLALVMWTPHFKQLITDIRTSILLLSMGIYFFLNIMSLLWTDNYYYCIKEIVDYLLILLTALMFKNLPKLSLQKAISAFLLGMGLSELISYAIIFGILDPSNSIFRPSASVSDPSPFIHHVHYSILLCMSIYLMLIRILLEQRSLAENIIYVFFICSMITNLFFNAGRSGQYAFLLSLGVFFITYYRVNWIKSLILSFCVSIIISILFLNISPLFKNRLIETFYSINYYIQHGKGMEDSTGMRFQMWNVGMNVGNERWLLGHGLAGAYDDYKNYIEEHSNQYSVEAISQFRSVHNRYIQTYMELGLVGLVSLIGWFIQFFRSNSRMARSQILLSRMIGIVFLLTFIVEPLLKSPYTGGLLGLMMGIVLNKNYCNEDI